MLKSSRWIKEQAELHGLLTPFVDHSVRQGVISYGLGPYGYDLRLDETYKKISPRTARIDPHHVPDADFLTLTEERITIEPGNYILARSVEYFRMPKKIVGLVFGKSTYARSGILVNVTPLEPEWTGFLTISIANTARVPALLYPQEGIAQVLFLESDDLPLFSYKDLNGTYNDQQEITLSKIG